MTAVDGEVQELNERVDEGLSGVGGEVRGLSQPLTIRLPDKTSIEIGECKLTNPSVQRVRVKK